MFTMTYSDIFGQSAETNYTMYAYSLHSFLQCSEHDRFRAGFSTAN